MENLKDQNMAEDLDPALDILPSLIRRKSQRHESQKLSDDLDWESTWTKRSLLNDDEP